MTAKHLFASAVVPSSASGQVRRGKQWVIVDNSVIDVTALQDERSGAQTWKRGSEGPGCLRHLCIPGLCRPLAFYPWG